MDFFERIGNLVSGRGWTSNKERDDEEKRKQQQATRNDANRSTRTVASGNSSAPSVSVANNNQKTVADPKKQRLITNQTDDGPLSPLEEIQLKLRGQQPTYDKPVEGISPELWKKMSPEVRARLWKTQNDVDVAKSAVFNPAVIANDVSSALVSGMQQSAGNVADVAVMGGNVIEDTAAMLQGKSQEERNKIYDRYNAARDQIKNAKTVTGDSFNPNEDFQFTGDLVRDTLNLTGRSLRVGLDATQFVNPARAFTKGATDDVLFKEAAKFATRDAAFFGTGEGLAAGTQTYGETGDVGQALTTAGQAAAASALTQGAMDMTAHGLGVGARNVADGTQKIAARVQDELVQAKTVRQQVEAQAAQVPEVIPVAKGVGSKNMAKAAKQQAEASVQQAKVVEGEATVKAEQANNDAITATKVADELQKPAVTEQPSVPKIEAPTKPKADAANVAYVDKRVTAAQERVDYLKREMAPPEQVRQAEAELKAAQNEAATTPVPQTPKVEGKSSAPAPATVVAAEVPAKTVKTVAPIVEKPAAPTAKPALSGPKLTKAGTVNKQWFKGELDRISADTTLTQAQKLKAAKKLHTSVRKAEADAAALRAQSKAPVSQKRELAKPTVQKTTGKAKRAAQRAKAKVEGDKITKGKKAGGNVSAFMAERANKITGNAQVKSDFMSSVKDKQTAHFGDDYRAAQGKIAKMDDESVISMAQTHKSSIADSADANGQTRPLSYSERMDVFVLSDRYAYIVDEISSKKKPSKADLKKLERTKQAQADLYEAMADSSQDSGRSLGLLGWLYKQLDPTIVSQRILKKMEDAGAPYTKVQEEWITAATKDLKQKFNAHDAATSRIDELTSQLSKDTDPAIRQELSAELDTIRSKEDALRTAYNDINVMTKQHWMDAEKRGDVSSSKTYGFGLNKYQKLNMLSGVFGRVRDMGTTGATFMDMFMDDVNAALTGKVANLFNGKRKFDSEVLAKGGATGRGLKEGFRKTVATFTGKEDTNMGLDAIAGGNRKRVAKSAETDRLIINPDEMGKTRLPKTGLRKALSVPANMIRGSVAMPSHIFGETYKARALNRAGLNEARRMGLKGADATLYARAMEANPSQAIRDAAEYSAKEVSGLQSKWSQDIDKLYRNLLYKHATWDGNKSVPGWRTKRAGKMAAGAGITAAKNTIIPFTSWPLGTGKNIVQRQSVLFNYGKSISETVKAVRSGDGAAANAALKHFARGNYNVAKLAAATYMLAPLLSDDDANGDSYNPPYIKIKKPDGTYWSNDLSILGPLSAPLINAWAFKKAQEAADRGDNSVSAYFANLAAGSLNKVGLSGTLNGQGIPIVDAATEVVSSPYRDAESKGNGLEDATVKMLGDVASQSIPIGSFQRDMNSLINLNPEFQFAPQTKVQNDDGSTNWLMTTANQLGSSLIGVNQLMEDNDEGKVADSPINRIIGAKDMNQAAQDKEKKLVTLNESLNGVLGNDKMRNLLDDDLAKVYDKAGKKKLTSKEVESVRNELIKGADKLIEENDYDSYIKVKQLQADKISEDRTSTEADKKKVNHEMTVASTLRDNKYEYKLYKMYAKGSKSDGSDEDGFQSGISESELKKMVDPDGDYYKPELANKLIDMDQKLAEAGVSDNSLDSTVPKYSLKAIFKKSKSGSGYRYGGGGGGGSSKIATDVGTVNLSALKTVSGPALKYRALSGADSPIPNLSAQTAKTNLKKAISVQKGVKLG